MRPVFIYTLLVFPFFIEVSCTKEFADLTEMASISDTTGVNHQDSMIIPQKSVDKVLEENGQIWLDTLCSRTFQGRRAATEGNRRAFEFLSHEVAKIGYASDNQMFFTDGGAIMDNLIITIPGRSDSTIIIGAHYDGAVQSNAFDHFQAAEDNASGTVALLMVLQQLRLENRILHKTIKCCFWDGEEAFEGGVFHGSSYFVKSISNIQFILHYQNLDTIGHAHDWDQNGLEDIYIEYLGNERIALMAYSMAENGRFDYHVSQCSFFNSDYTPFYKAGIPIINYHDHLTYKCQYRGHSTSDIKDVVSIERLIKVAHNVCESIDSF